MAIGPTYAQFGDVELSRGFDFTFSPGVQPSVCTIYTVPHTQQLPQVAQLQLRSDGDVTLTFNECLLEEPKLSAGPGGQIWILPIKDRRWKWQWGAVYGHYNKPEPNGTYTRELSPQQMASLLLAQMGESGYDVARLPNTTRPERKWDGALPAAELDNLCASLGCVVVLNPFTDQVEIWPIGQGSPLPSGGTLGQAYTPVLAAQPAQIIAQAAPTKHQSTFDTEAVGLDTDGVWRPINALSYKPSHGWSGAAAMNGFHNIPDSHTYMVGGRTLKIRELAAATVFRSYRVKGHLGGDWTLPTPITDGIYTGLGAPTVFSDYLLTDKLVDEEISPEDGSLRPLSANVFARWARHDKPTPPVVIKYPESVSFDAEHGIVHFGEPLFLWGSGQGSLPATVHYECAFYAGELGVWRRCEQNSLLTAPSDTPPQLIQIPELERRIVWRHSNTGQLITTEDNLSSANLLGKMLLQINAMRAQYNLQQGGTVNYERLKPISPDGLTQQVTWSGGGGRAAITTVSQAQRHNRFITPLDEYRERLNAKRTQQQLQAIETLRRVSVV